MKVVYVARKCQPRIDLTGMRYGRLVAQKPVRDARGRVVWSCGCDCGAVVSVSSKYLRSGNTRSCGCLHREELSAAATTHGMRSSREYAIWCAMIARCTNPKNASFASYGGRGIKVCGRWTQSFEAFLADVGMRPTRRHSIDRFPDNNGDYEPGNVRWATPQQQGRNTRRTRIIACNGRSMCLTDWAVETGLSISTIAGRLKAGRSPEEALSCA